MREHAGGPDHPHAEPQRFVAAIALPQTVADGARHLHAIGEAHHHHERRHDIEEQVELEACPTERTERPHHRQDRRQHRHHHEGKAAKEHHRDHGAEDETKTVVDEAVAFDGVADFELHHRRASELDDKAGRLEGGLSGLPDALDDGLRSLPLHRRAVERQNDHGERAIVGQELAGDDLVLAQRLHHGLELRFVGWQVIGHDRRGVACRIRFTACRQHRDDAGNAVGKLQFDRRLAKGFKPRAR